MVFMKKGRGLPLPFYNFRFQQLTEISLIKIIPVICCFKILPQCKPIFLVGHNLEMLDDIQMHKFYKVIL